MSRQGRSPNGSHFPIAPMDTTMSVLTAGVLALFPLCVVMAILVPLQAGTFGLAAIALATLYVVVWVWFRPYAFEVTATELTLLYPVRKRVIPRSVIRGAKLYTQREFRQTWGWAFRIGVGGLFGGFGLLVTSKGTLDMAITCTDELVVVTCLGRRSLLLTPADVEGFVAALS